jgi:hypothetical protein
LKNKESEEAELSLPRVSAGFLLALFFDPEDWRGHVPLKCCALLNYVACTTKSAVLNNIRNEQTLLLVMHSLHSLIKVNM